MSLCLTFSGSGALDAPSGVVLVSIALSPNPGVLYLT